MYKHSFSGVSISIYSIQTWLCLAQARRIAAATLLQKRLPSIFARRASIHQKRNKAKVWYPWCARRYNAIARVITSRIQALEKESSPPPEDKILGDITQVNRKHSLLISCSSLKHSYMPTVSYPTTKGNKFCARA